MRHPLSFVLLVLLVCAALAGFAFYAAPHACNGGWEWYAAAGLVAVAALVAIGWLLLPRHAVWPRLFGSGALALLGVGTWAAGGVLANFRVLCRLI